MTNHDTNENDYFNFFFVTLREKNKQMRRA
jgi:hypothetical protein